MVVDDEPSIRSLLATVLTKANYEVIEASDASTLREAFSGPQPEVMLLDLKLPDADGLELLPAIKKQWPQTEVIILTGHATIDAAVAATKLGAYDFQKKPFDHKSLLVAVERAGEDLRRLSGGRLRHHVGGEEERRDNGGGPRGLPHAATSLFC